VTRYIIAVIALVASMAAETSVGAQTNADPPRLWFYASVNFQVDESTDRFIGLLRRAKTAGYNGAAVTDYKFGMLQGRIERYYHNLRRTRSIAAELGIELIPFVMPIGYSNSILQNNPNLAASLPVRECRFVVNGRTATVTENENLLPGGGFEVAERNRPKGWDWIDGFGQSTSLDTMTQHGGACSLKLEDFQAGNEHGNCRVSKTLNLKPYHQYRLTMWVRTDGLRGGEFKAMPLAKGYALSHANLGVKPTQDWTRHRIVFNSLENEEVQVYVGLWGGESGTVWIDDLRLEQVGGINLVRRPGCPIRITSDDGQSEYVEGRDFEHWADPKLGKVPYAGEFSDDHDAPQVQLTADSRIRPGQQLRVSFYHTSIIYDGQVCCSLLSDELFQHLRRQVELLDEFWKPDRYFMQHDEIRLAGHDELAGGRSSGELLAENARRCVKLIRDVNVEAEILVWSDMFDPHHNARDNYYLVRGSLAGSWEGLDANVVIGNWNGNKPRDSLNWFSRRRHPQIIAGYYDGDVRANLKRWHEAADGVNGVVGFMYTTWRNRYDDMEAFAEIVRAHHGRRHPQEVGKE
jgi:hypothetical protein